MEKLQKEEKEIMTAKEVADYLSFSKNWVYKKAETGEIPGVRLGGNWRFKKSIIDEWLEGKFKTSSEKENQ